MQKENHSRVIIIIHDLEREAGREEVVNCQPKGQQQDWRGEK